MMFMWKDICFETRKPINDGLIDILCIRQQVYHCSKDVPLVGRSTSSLSEPQRDAAAYASAGACRYGSRADGGYAALSICFSGVSPRSHFFENHFH